MSGEIHDIFISEALVRKAINHLRVNSAPGPDGLPPILFLKLANVISIPLAIIFRDSLNFGRLPQEWKCAVVTPIYKGKGDCTDCKNYRPISLTNVACKLLEFIVRFQLIDYLLGIGHFEPLSVNPIISAEQHGFLPGRSTQTQLLDSVFLWSQALNIEHGRIDIIYTDLAKAFDSVSHKKLLFKLSKYG